MKNKILLGSMTLLSALMVAACGNGEQKATETTVASTTEVTTATPTTTVQTTTAGSSTTKEVSLADTQRVGSEKLVISTFLKIGSYTHLKIANNSSNIHQLTNTMYYQ